MVLVGDKETDGFFVMFPFFSSEERKRIVENTVCRVFKKGEVVFDEGDTPDGLVCLSQGKVKVYKKGISGKEQIVRLVKSWNLLGYQALLANEQYIASARTLEQSVVCLLKRDCLSDLLKSNSAFAIALLQHVSRTLGFSDIRMLALTQKHVRARLADSLMLLSDIYGFQEDGQTINADLSREDLAKLSNMTASNATRTLTNFQKEGIVELGGRRVIRLVNTHAINRISEQG